MGANLNKINNSNLGERSSAERYRRRPIDFQSSFLLESNDPVGNIDIGIILYCHKINGIAENLSSSEFFLPLEHEAGEETLQWL